MAGYRPPVDDIVFLLRRVIDSDRVLGRPPCAHVDGETLEAVVRQAGRLAADVIAPINRDADRIGAAFENGVVRLPPGFDAAYRACCEGGWPSLALPEKFGGQAMPEIAQAAVSEMFNGASLAFTMLTVTGRAAARVLLAHAGEAIQALYVPRLASGEWAGAIVMTEPHAGSDIGRARTKAVPNPDDGYALTGTKIFISFGEHDATGQICHIVLARIEGAPDGVRGLSLFLVPKFLVGRDGALGARNGVRAARIEEKMGIHGSPTCEMRLDGATGFLLGEPGRGVQNMFTMINVMRLEVALEGVGIAGAALDKALGYAAERIQGGNDAADGAPIVEHADVRRMLLTMKAQTGGARALAYEAACQLDIARGADDAETAAEAAALAAFLLPVCKAHCTDLAVEVASLAVQVHGGHGYIAEHGVEQLMRDARITPIYEGANGIQAIDLVLRRLGRDDGATLETLARRIEADLAAAAVPAVPEIHAALANGLAMVRAASAHILDRLAAEATPDALAGATPYLRLVATVAVGWMWRRMAEAAENDPFGAEIRALARFYALEIMPNAAALAASAGNGAAHLYALDARQIARV